MRVMRKSISTFADYNNSYTPKSNIFRSSVMRGNLNDSPRIVKTRSSFQNDITVTPSAYNGLAESVKFTASKSILENFSLN
jgi:hypothetical protein